MPKVIDNYILEQKIGSGQFGDVYKGYHSQNGQQVAIKAIRRQTIKGKFYQLLENQIKVLKTCDNANIIKLYAIKKTANHFYLMLEYCNQGDMLAYVRKIGSVSQEKAIKFFCQILNAFQDLVKHKIMHRDFKLANILLHNGNIKIADFGFAKLLSTQDYATTMLGSPLNMAPQVLGGNKYNSKADIWSIGACLWQMLYGKPPYVASNMVDLLNTIKTKPLKFPLTPKINETLKDVLKKMLVADSKRRISWNDLFNHPINTYLANQLRQQINLELIEDESLVMNTSKFYLKKNLVIDNAEDIHENQKMNQYLLDVIKDGKKKNQFQIQKNNSQKQKQMIPQQKQTQQKIKAQQKQVKTEKVTQQKSQKKVQSKQQKQDKLSATKSLNQSHINNSFKNNMKKIMHYRNIYVFLANVSDQVLSSTCFNQTNVIYSQKEVVAYFIIQKILKMMKWLMSGMKSNKCVIPDLQNWDQFRNTKQLSEVSDYFDKQLQIFSVFNKSIEPNIKKGLNQGKYGVQVKNMLNDKFDEKDFTICMKKYVKSIAKQMTLRMLAQKKTQIYKPLLRHIEYSLIACDTQRIFGKKQFNFKQFYDSFNSRTVQQSLLRIQRMIKQI